VSNIVAMTNVTISRLSRRAINFMIGPFQEIASFFIRVTSPQEAPRKPCPFDEIDCLLGVTQLWTPVVSKDGPELDFVVRSLFVDERT